MKYIKTYEECTDLDKLRYDDCSDSWYWQISNKYPDILVILDKLGIPEGWGEGWLWFKDNYRVDDYYLFKTKLKNGKFEWSHAGLGFENPDYRKPPIYMGEVEITDEDREKWKIKQISDKYNI